VSSPPGAEDAQIIEGLRERKKRLTRQLITDTATAMFLEHGFDEVKVADIAVAAGVSEKTVYNYFPSKESLLLDREEEMAQAIRAALGPGATTSSPIDGALEVLNRDLDEMRHWWHRDRTGPDGLLLFRRFMDLFESTASLRAAQREMMEHLVRVAAEAMAERAHVSPEDPEPQIAAHAILGLWTVQWMAIRRHADSGLSSDDVLDQAAADVRRAARLIDSGLWAFGAMVQGRGDREQLTAAADAAQGAARQVAAALRQARTVWRQIQDDAPSAKHPPQAEWKRAQREQREQWRKLVQVQHEQWRAAQQELREQQRRMRTRPPQ
jgi:AcrR family transcriptional regulator